MSWLRTLGPLEYSFIAIFLFLYIFYIIRITLIARKMKSPMRSVFYKFFLRSFYFFLLIVALLGPTFGNVKKEIKSLSKEIYLVLDLSLSMNATDVQPSRLEKAKQEVKKIIQEYPSDKFSLIGFSSVSYMICPPTFDKTALNLFVETLNTDLTGTEGSDLSAGIQLALNSQNKYSSNLNQTIVLITDGEDFGGRVLNMAKEISKRNIHLVVLGIGTEKGSTIPFNGNLKKDKLGEVVETKINRSLLKEIAEESDGYYYEINNNINEINSLLAKVNTFESEVNEVREVDESENKYLYFLTIALIFIIIDVLVTVKTVQI